MLSRHTHTHTQRYRDTCCLDNGLGSRPPFPSRLPSSSAFRLSLACLCILKVISPHFWHTLDSREAFLCLFTSPLSPSLSISISHNPPADYSVVVSALAIFLAANLVGHKFDFMFAKQNYAYKSCTDRGTLIKRLPYAPTLPPHAVQRAKLSHYSYAACAPRNHCGINKVNLLNRALS